MLSDESDEEEEQKNFEMEMHLTDWVTVNQAHGYRGEMRHKIEQDSKLSTKERSHAEQMNRQSDFWLVKGVEINQSNQLQAAIPCYKQALKLNPENFLAMYNLATNYERLKKFSAALKWLRLAVEVKPDFDLAHRACALNLFKLGNYREAIKSIRQSIRIYESLKDAQLAKELEAKRGTTLSH